MEQQPFKRLITPVEKIGRVMLNILEDIGELHVATSPALILKDAEHQLRNQEK